MSQDQLNKQLFKAVEANDIEAVKRAIEGGADVNATDENGDTPLHYPAVYGNTELAKILIEAGADLNAKNKWGSTPLYLAAYNGRTETAELLKQHGGV